MAQKEKDLLCKSEDWSSDLQQLMKLLGGGHSEGGDKASLEQTGQQNSQIGKLWVPMKDLPQYTRWRAIEKDTRH